MKFILTEEEMNSYIERKEHGNIVAQRNNEIALLEKKVDILLKAYQNTDYCSMKTAREDEDYEYYCDHCPLATINNKLTPGPNSVICEHQEFSK